MTHPRSIRSAETGVALFIGLALISVFFIFAAFAIDLAVMSSALNQARDNARLTALAALGSFFEQSCAGLDDNACYTLRSNAALNRARDVAGANIILMDAGSGAKEVQWDVEDEGSPSLQTGRWYSVKPSAAQVEEGESDNPCSDNYPCFIPGNKKVNAMRFHGNTYTGIARTFSRVFAGSSPTPVNVSAIASVVPRHGCFLVDISGSTTLATHLPYAKDEMINPDPLQYETVPRSSYALLLAGDNGTSPTEEDQDVWNKMWGIRPLGALSTPIRHYQSDYEPKRPLTDSDYDSDPDYQLYHPDPETVEGVSADALAGTYRLDFYRDGGYTGPEPLTTIFEGLNAVVGMFRERAVAGDMACLIFYDRFLTWPRVVKLTGDFDYLSKFTDPNMLTHPTSAEGYLRSTYVLTDGTVLPDIPLPDITGGSWQNLEAAPLTVRHGVYPSFYYGFTWTSKAIRFALDQFQSQGATVEASAFLVHIGDGLTNCDDNYCDSQYGPYDLNGDGDHNADDLALTEQALKDRGCWGVNGDYETNGGDEEQVQQFYRCWDFDFDGDGNIDADDVQTMQDNPDWWQCKACENSFERFWDATDDLQGIARYSLFPGHIPLHVIMVGDHVAPHTRDITVDGVCMNNDKEIRQKGIVGSKGMFVLGGQADGTYFSGGYDIHAVKAWNDMLNGKAPLYQANLPWYQLARITGGIWAPIRPKLPGCSTSDPAPSCGSAVGTELTGGRRIYDPLCRDPKDQIKGYMKEIIEQNPYGIVYSD